MFFLQACTFLTLMTNRNHHEDGRFYQAGRRRKDGENDADSAQIALFCDGIASALRQKGGKRSQAPFDSLSGKDKKTQ